MDYLNFLLSNRNYFEDFITRSTYHSNAIEGSTLSVNETYALLFDAKHCNIENASPREIYEAINHKKILTILFNKIKNKERMSHELLLEINRTINENILYVGGYRLGPIRIRGSEKNFPLPLNLEEKMQEFINYYNHLYNVECNLLEIAKMHIQYENIHPFPDGNGRTGRILINYLLLMKNQAPIVIPFSKRKQYLEYMENNDEVNLSKLFEKLQKEEIERIEDFNQM